MEKTNIENYTLSYFQFDEPCPLYLDKGGRLTLYPIKVIDYPMYLSTRQIMEIEKNEIGDIDIIQMSYLEFLVERVFQEIPGEEQKLLKFIHLITKEDYIRIDRLEDEYVIVIAGKKDEGFYTKYVIDNNTLLEIYRVSSYQNDITYDDRYYSPEVKEAMEDYYRLKYGNSHAPSFEKQRAYVISQTGMNPEFIKDMTYRTFNQVFKACIGSERYIVDYMMKTSPNYNIKEEISHPLYKAEVDKLNEVFVDSSELTKKIH